ncbi:HTH-type transcriptional repressor KstR2 [Paenibacillus konkukensis]|uniref:HTH-type transcriptional repressor KstR2 n=1 Tax=Paenibacillus konkukensis TaxID=2020716 RepID=A0ABY4RHZ4_9BACL|nr:TetR/AcrR family transcriptional regulator [Paenibacillus konkukensis]UQZ81052.1 HTH-type transcriptional repressor KstR2 [Paenibacillus konkukensis]
MQTHNLFKELQSLHSGKQTVKQKRIIEAAIALFAEKGYSNTSTAEIAKVAEVSEGSIFKHYGKKDKLLISLIAPHLKDLFASQADVVLSQFTINDGTSFEGVLKGVLKNRVEFISENRELFQVIIKEIIYQEELKNEILPFISEIITPRLTLLVESAKERGELVDLPTDRICNMLFTFIGGLLASRFVILNQHSISDDEIEDAVRFVMEGIGKSARS